ncbi:MAG: NHLP leader peptide family RiPP precursor [Chloroflexi bacterium]|nr:NHLP leader peptide family RiPP precursor [Chloroflexota bacterium]MBU1746603.1 NHLP leader peptide family RiPP precursor [Chloroflexota bacterium]
MAAQKDTLMDVLQRATTDPDFRASLKADPAQALAAAGVDVPAGVTYTVVENTPDQVHIILPPLTEEDELSGETLEARATKTTLLCTPGPGGMVTLMPVCIIA